MDDLVPPAYGAPEGPLCTRGELLERFIRGEGTGRGGRLRVEGSMLITESGAVAALLVGPHAVLVRGTGALEDPAAEVSGELTAAGLALVEADPLLADVVAMMACGLLGTRWDLWGRDVVIAREGLRRAAAGDVAVDLGQVERRVAEDGVIAAYESQWRP